MKPNEKVMVNGRLSVAPSGCPFAEIERGMKIIAADGCRTGFVGGVLVDTISETITHLLLCCLPETAVYRLIPVHLIAQIDENSVTLSLPCDAMKKLTIHQPAQDID